MFFCKLIGITNAGNDEDQNINYGIPIQIVKRVVDNILYYYDDTNAVNVQKISLGITVDSANSNILKSVMRC